MHLNAILADTEHIPGKLNVIFDVLSRQVSPQDLGLDPALMFPADTDASVVQFIACRRILTYYEHVHSYCYVK